MAENTESKNHPWKFYTTTSHSWDAMIELIKGAKTAIDFEQFIFAPDNIGRRFVEALVEKAKEGVRIRVLIDAMGSVGLNQSMYVEAMERAGIQVRFFNWLLPFSKGNKKFWYFRNHRRSLVVDAKTLFTGGACIADRTKDWRETMVAITDGETVLQAKVAFEKIWENAHKQTVRMGGKTKTDLDGFSFVTQSPLPRQRFLYYKLIEQIKQAQHYIYLTTPYFLPDNRLLRALIKARKRNVNIQIIIPRYSDHPVVDRGSHTYFQKVLAAGIHIYRYRGMIHSKTAVVDGNWAMIGTLNLDNVSLRYNFEAGIMASNHHFATEAAGHFMNDLQNTDEITLAEWQKRSWFAQFLELCVWPIRKFL